MRCLWLERSHTAVATTVFQARSYFWVKDGKKAVHVDLFTDELGLQKREKMSAGGYTLLNSDQSLHNTNNSSHLCHLDHIGKLCQTGDGNHIMVGFQLVPVIKQSVGFQSCDATFLRTYQMERDDPVWTIIKTSPPSPLSLALSLSSPTRWPKYSICYSAVGTTALLTLSLALWLLQ